jgi:hypothetical protein
MAASDLFAHYLRSHVSTVSTGFVITQRARISIECQASGTFSTRTIAKLPAQRGIPGVWQKAFHPTVANLTVELSGNPKLGTRSRLISSERSIQNSEMSPVRIWLQETSLRKGRINFSHNIPEMPGDPRLNCGRCAWIVRSGLLAYSRNSKGANWIAQKQTIRHQINIVLGWNILELGCTTCGSNLLFSLLSIEGFVATKSPVSPDSISPSRNHHRFGGLLQGMWVVGIEE